MNWKTTFLNLFVLLLMTGTAFAQTTSDGSEADDAESDYAKEKEECRQEYNEDMAKAKEDYAEDKAKEDDERSSSDAAPSKPRDENDTADGKYREEKTEIEREYQDCLKDAREDYEKDRYKADVKEAEERDKELQKGRAEACKAQYESDKGAANSQSDAARDADNDSAKDEASMQRDAAKDSRDECEDDDKERDFQNSYDGRHVAFDLSRTGLRNYSVDDVRILDSVSLQFPVEWEDFERHGASIKVEGEYADLKVSDSATGVLRFKTDDDARVYVAFADGVNAVHSRGDNPDDVASDGEIVKHRVLLQGDGFRAYLWVKQGYLVDDRGIIADSDFRLVKVSGGALEKRDAAVVDAISNGRLAIEVDVAKAGATEIEYGDVTIEFQNATDGLIATVEGHGEGKTVLFNLAPDAYESLDDLQVIYDGEPIGFANGMEDVMDVSDGIAEYIIVVGAESTQVLVQIPHFSVHTIQLQGTTVGVTGSVAGVAMIVGGGAAAAFIAVTMIGRRRD
jgi:hypothetical protein